jgi:hypothetical protein
MEKNPFYYFVSANITFLFRAIFIDKVLSQRLRLRPVRQKGVTCPPESCDLFARRIEKTNSIDYFLMLKPLNNPTLVLILFRFIKYVPEFFCFYL